MQLARLLARVPASTRGGNERRFKERLEWLTQFAATGVAAPDRPTTRRRCPTRRLAALTWTPHIDGRGTPCGNMSRCACTPWGIIPLRRAGQCQSLNEARLEPTDNPDGVVDREVHAISHARLTYARESQPFGGGRVGDHSHGRCQERGGSGSR